MQSRLNLKVLRLSKHIPFGKKKFFFFQFYSLSKRYNGNTACLGNSNKSKGIERASSA